MADKGLIPRPVKQEERLEEDVFDMGVMFQELNLNKQDSNFPVWLENVESPFNWLPTRFSDVPSKEVITKATERIQMDEGFDASFPFEKFVRILTLVFEFSHQGQEGKAEDQLTLCDQLLSEERDKDSAVYDSLGAALTHSVQATRAHLFLRRGHTEQAKKVAEDILPVSCMTVHGQATVHAMKARFFYHYRGKGVQLAVSYARNALALAPEEPLWQVLTAEAIRRLRKFLPGVEQVSAEEVSLLESAVAVQRNARHLVLLAQAYRESGDATFKQHRMEPNFFQSQIFSDISDMQAKAFLLYKEALSLRPDYEVVNRLCGYGLLKLPAFKSDYRLAQHCLQRALEQSPNNPTTIHSLGLYYYKALMEYEKAALFCEKAGKLGNFPASLDMLRMKRLVYGDNYDPVFDFGKLLHQYGDDQTKRHEVLCQMGSYYLFFERDLSKALKYFKILIEEKAELSIMKSHKCTFLNMTCKIDLFELIVNEGTQLLLKNAEDGQKKDPEDEEYRSFKNVKAFLDELRLTQPELFIIPINKTFIDDLHKVSDSIKQTYIRKKERRDSCKERQRNFDRRRCSLDDNLTLTRNSESSPNFRRSSSGNVSDVLQGRMFKSQKSPNSKKQFFGSIHPNSSESIDESEKPLGSSQRCFPVHKSYSRLDDNFRRRSSGAISDLKQNQVPRSMSNRSYRQQSFEGIPQEISESHEISQERTFNDSLGRDRLSGYQMRPTTSRNDRSQYNRYNSWGGTNKTEKSQIENWRMKDDLSPM